MKYNNELSILLIADYQAEHGGTFLQSIRKLSEGIKRNGGSVCYLFPKKMDYTAPLKVFGKVYYENSYHRKNIDLPSIKRIYKIVKENDIKIIHTHFGRSIKVAASLVSRLTGAIHLSHHHSPWHSYERKSFVKKLKAKIFFKTIDMVGKNYHVAVSNEIRDMLINYKEYPASKVMVISNAVDIEVIESKKEEDIDSKETIGLAAKKNNIIGMIANFGASKDHETLVKAASIVVERIPNTKFVLIGKSHEGAPRNSSSVIKSHIEQAGLHDKFVFLGELTNPIPVVQLFDVGVLLSNYEGLPYVILEYMANKKPIIATKVGGNKDIDLDREFGYLCEPQDYKDVAGKIIHLLENKDKALSMGKEAYKRVKSHYNMDNWVHAIISTYQKFLS